MKENMQYTMAMIKNSKKCNHIQCINLYKTLQPHKFQKCKTF